MRVMVISDRLDIFEEGELLRAPSCNPLFPYVVRLDSRDGILVNISAEEFDSPVKYNQSTE